MEESFTPGDQSHLKMEALFISILSWFFVKGTAEHEHLEPKKVQLLFSIELNQEIYKKSVYGEPPQFAIWLQSRDHELEKLVFVTYKTATSNFEGRAEVPVALPFWKGIFHNSNENTTPEDSLHFPHGYDAVSGATPNNFKFSTIVEVDLGSEWHYFIEVNVAGDFNKYFPSYHPDGSNDAFGNGQPSIIYKGEIDAFPHLQSTPMLIGRTEQMYYSPNINSDLSGIEDAQNVFKSISVNCLEK